MNTFSILTAQIGMFVIYMLAGVILTYGGVSVFVCMKILKSFQNL